MCQECSVKLNRKNAHVNGCKIESERPLRLAELQKLGKGNENQKVVVECCSQHSQQL